MKVFFLIKLLKSLYGKHRDLVIVHLKIGLSIHLILRLQEKYGMKRANSAYFE